MGGRQPADVTLAVLMKPLAVEWTEQRRMNSLGSGFFRYQLVQEFYRASLQPFLTLADLHPHTLTFRVHGGSFPAKEPPCRLF